MTKWEKFAKEKGIKKRKRSKLVYDEQTDEWKRRHGYDRVKDADRIIIADAKMSDVPGKTEDPFTREERERRERVEKNQGKQLKNLQNAVATHGKHVLPPTLQMSAAPKKGVKALPLNGMKKQQIRDLTAQVAKSTASMAKYNAPIPGDEKIKTRGRRRQFDSVTDTGTERERAQGFIDKLVRREKDFTVDVNVAARKIQRAKEAENRSAKKAKLLEKDSGAGGKGGKHGKSAAGLKVKGMKGKKGKK
jgi:regulator of ribosome biosynthesis